MFNQPNLSGEYVHYFSGDPAFDQDHAEFDHAKWCETGDEKFLPRRDGAPEPYQFTLRHLNARHRYWLTQVTQTEGAIMAAYFAVALAVVDVPFIPTKDGGREELRRVRDGRYTVVCDEHMGLFDDVVLGEIARRVYTELNGNPL